MHPHHHSSDFRTKAVLRPLAFGALSLTAAALLFHIPASDAAEGDEQTAAVPSLQEAIVGGKPLLNVRLRYERADEDNALRNADAFTTRLRLGYQTGSWRDFDVALEFEGTFSPGSEDFNSGPPILEQTNGRTQFSTVLDPTDEEVNRAWIRYRGIPDTDIKLGRQLLILDNARFIGNVLWRQNEQTFDALTIVNRSVDGLTLTYSHIRRQNFVLFNENRMNSHVFHAAYALSPQLNISAYGYLLDYIESSGRIPPAPDNRVLGLRLTGKLIGFQYALEFADQADYGDAPSSVDAEYYAASLKRKIGPLVLGVGYEVLGGDGTFAFQTPLGTNHAFQGFADVFLITPPSGVRDLNGQIGGRFAGFMGLIRFHQFFSDEDGDTIGNEIDVVLARPITPQLRALLKFASYNAKGFGVDTQRYWAQLEYSF